MYVEREDPLRLLSHISTPQRQAAGEAMGRRPCCAKVGLNRGSWSASEDMILTNYVLAHGEGKWRDLPRRAGLKRCGKSCRLRWLNYLRPDIKRGNITNEEEDLIIRLHNLLGNRWSLIAGRLPGRTDNEIKNYWNTNLRKRFNGSGNANSGSPSSRTGTNRTQPSTTTKAMVSRRTTTTTTMTTNTTTTSLVPQDHSVVRTKAVRCTGTYAVQTDDVLLQKNRESPANNPIQIGWPLPLKSMRNDVDNPLGVFVDVDVGLQCHGSDHLMHVEQDKAQIADQEGNMFFFEDLVPLEDYWKDYLQPNVDSGDLKDLISFLDGKY